MFELTRDLITIAAIVVTLLFIGVLERLY